MKLKRILSLAAAGVLAVSMLTGCFGGGNGNKVSVANDFVATLNGATNADPEIESNKKLTNAIRSVAEDLTVAQAAKEGLADSEVLAAVRDKTNTIVKPELDNPSPWSAYNGAKNFSTVRIYKAEGVTVSALANEVANDIFKVINLKNATDGKTTDGKAFTNEYETYAAAVEVTIPGDDIAASTSVYVVGIQINRTTTDKPAQ